MGPHPGLLCSLRFGRKEDHVNLNDVAGSKKYIAW